MNAIIINRPKPNRAQMAAKRFQKMIQSLKKGGINARYHPLQTKNELLNVINQEKPDLVYCANYYVADESGGLVNAHKLLDDHQICRIGSTPEVLELVMSKTDLKKKWVESHVITPRFFELYQDDGKVIGLDVAVNAADFPYILKPDREGNSRGLDRSSIVFDEVSLKQKSSELLQKYSRVLVEKFLGDMPDFHEYTVAMIGSGENMLLMPAEIQLKIKKRVRIVTTEDKDEHNTRALPVMDLMLSRKLTAFAAKAYTSAGMRDYSRLDVIMVNGVLYAIEINGLPMIPDKWFEVCAKASGMNSDQYINAIFLSCIHRAQVEGRGNGVDLQIPPEMRHLLPEDVFERLTRLSA